MNHHEITAERTVFPRVVVFGAGIAGLSAAQELAERGFHVHVIDPGGAGDEVEVGGIAKTQWKRIPTTEPKCQDFIIIPRSLRKITLTTLNHDNFDKTAPNPTPTTKYKIRQFAKIWHTARIAYLKNDCTLADPIPVYTLALCGPDDGKKRTEWKKYLARFNIIITTDRTILPNDVDQQDVPWTLEADSSVLSSKEVPGEHGYRYFPGFYRNLLDTMSRAKLYEGAGCNRRQTRYTLADNLIAAPDLHIALPDERPPITLSRRKIRSFEEFRRILSERIGRLNASSADVRHLERRMFRYLTSSTPRREHQYQKQIWWDFLEGYKLRPDLHDLLRHTPQALIAMNADEIDARTHGNILVQLLLDHLRTGVDTDQVLNGPTSISLFLPWKEYLESIGVLFHKGYVKSLYYHKKSGRITPKTVTSDSAISETISKAQYYVLAVPYIQALRLTQTLFADSSPTTVGADAHDKLELGKLGRHFRSVLQMASPSITDNGESITTQQLRMPRPFDPKHQYVWSFHRLFTGTQFLFDRNVQVGKGHTYYPASPWGLSSISQQNYWEKQDNFQQENDSSSIPPLQGILSVDIGDCDRPALSIIGNDAWKTTSTKGAIFTTAGGRISCSSSDEPNESTCRPVRPCNFDPSTKNVVPFLLAFELGFNVWQQVEEGLYRGTRDRFGSANWLSTDDHLMNYWHQSYDETGHHAAPPNDEGLPLSVEDLLEPPGPWYMISTPNLPWERRPGFYIDRPAFMTHDRAIQPLPWSENDQQAWNFDPDRMRVLSYEVSHGQWVLAGAYNKTYTRLETMEAANESARHAVNAILDHYMQSRDKSTPTKLQPMLAEYCKIWDPERNELEDLEVLRRLDELLMRDGLPHFMDLLELDSRLEASAAPSNVTQDRPLDLFLRLLDEATRATPSNESLKDLLTSGKFGGLGKLLSALDRSDSR